MKTLSCVGLSRLLLWIRKSFATLMLLISSSSDWMSASLSCSLTLEITKLEVCFFLGWFVLCCLPPIFTSVSGNRTSRLAWVIIWAI